MTEQKRLDHFAAAALTGILSHQGDVKLTRATDDAFSYALAMLERSNLHKKEFEKKATDEATEFYRNNPPFSVE